MDNAEAIGADHDVPYAQDTITILHSVGPKLTKVWKTDGSISGYGNAAHFTVEERPVASFDDLCRVLKLLENDPCACVIRGKLRNDWREVLAKNLPVWNAERRRKAEKDRVEFIPLNPTGNQIVRRQDLFIDAPHHWMLADVDNFSMNKGETYTKAIERYIKTLPPEFHNISYYWQMSASAGHARHDGKLKVHLWFWLAKKATGAELREWSKNAPVDSSVFLTVQPHYTAAPVFEQGAPVPALTRSGP